MAVEESMTYGTTNFNTWNELLYLPLGTNYWIMGGVQISVYSACL